MLRHSGGPLRAGPAAAAAAAAPRIAPGTEGAPRQVQSSAVPVRHRSRPASPRVTLVQNARPGPPRAQGELRSHSHLTMIKVPPTALAFHTRNNTTDSDRDNQRTEVTGHCASPSGGQAFAGRPPARRRPSPSRPRRGGGGGPCPLWRGERGRASPLPTVGWAGGRLPKAPSDE